MYICMYIFMNIVFIYLFISFINFLSFCIFSMFIHNIILIPTQFSFQNSLIQ